MAPNDSSQVGTPPDFLGSSGVAHRAYSSPPNTEVLRWVPEGAKEVLDLGCGSAGNACALASRGVLVDGVTLSPDEAKQASAHCRQVFVHDLEHGLPTGLAAQYDVILCSHVLEHLRFPSLLMDGITSRLAPGARAIVAVPNLLFYQSRVRLLLGKFEYAQDGIMDSTHFRWYTLPTLCRLLERHGLSVDFAYADGSAPLGPLRRVAPSVCARVDRFACASFPGLFGYQLLAIAGRDRNRESPNGNRKTIVS